MAQLVRISSGAPWEPVAAYSRAVKAGEFVAVSGTTAIDERGLVVGGGQMYVQARQALLNIRAALQTVGLSMQDVVRTRMFVTDISRFGEVARAHHEFFAEAPPASTMVEVTGLVHPAMLIEIEVDAYRGSAPEALERSKPKTTARKKSASKLKRRR
ncbi:MAG TPA: RidA family protein [Candidatus Binataceae bacterium]|nr:RidA family protein [Candidatus Binataceae bacterium]